MYVDDEESLVFLVTRSLERVGYAVEGFTDAKTALEVLRERSHDFSAVITDLSMPGMTGFEFSKAAREMNATLPIILTSGYVRQEDRDIAKQLGICEVILKPDTVDALATQLHELIATHTEDQLSAAPRAPSMGG